MLSRGFAPRTSAFAERRAETDYTLRARSYAECGIRNTEFSATTALFSFRTPRSAFRAGMASVIGLAPIRPDLKGRLLELLCIHGHKGVSSVEFIRNSKIVTRHLKWSPRLVSHQRLLLFREALICLSYSGGKTAVDSVN